MVTKEEYRDDLRIEDISLAWSFHTSTFSSWYHYVWVYDSDHDGVEEYLACDVKTFYAK